MTFPGTAPARRVHVPSVPTGTLPDPGGHDSVERAHRLQRQTADLYTRWRGLFPDGINPDELKDAAGQFAYSDAALSLQPALDAVKADSDAADSRVADAVKSVKVADDQHEAARRIWDRAKDRLDKAKTLAQKISVAQELIAGATGLTLGTYQEELPFFLKTEGVPTEWLAAAFAAEIPEAADAVASANRLQKSHAVLQANHQKLTRAMRQDTDVPPLLDPSSISDQPYSNPTGA